ncbi:hypothetical protein [Mucilaginibacter flavus]|uniref:hypothetical protein n=1 Tax=Mucilaginibacter flavus TaxID=931504 RepID=UPI0025B4D25C|nr:hypothetical protein [Mucilaginibacter flavus]MDN3581265.1 hypothetical protein [Mucilaginibacter flavus]
MADETFCANTSTLVTIVISVIASIITLGIVLIWNKMIIPFIETLLYKGIYVGEKWTIEMGDQTADQTPLSATRNTVLEIKQRANKLSGKATSSLILDNETSDCIFYNIEGEIKDRFVTLFLKCSTRSRMAYSTFLLEIVSDGSLMKGYRTFYGLKRERINAIACTLKKLPN